MLHCFGPWAGTVDGMPLSFRGQKAKALLTFLAVERERFSRPHLLGLFWPEMSEDDARNNLRVAWAQIKRALQRQGGDIAVLGANRRELWVDPEQPVWLDVVLFQQLLDDCRTHHHESRSRCGECQERLAKATALYRGEFLQGFTLDGCPAFDEWLFISRETLFLDMMASLTDLSDFHEAEQNYKRAEQFVRRQLELDPLREDAHRKLMRLMAVQGQRVAALAQFETCRDVLAQELGVSPDRETLLLREQIDSERLQLAPADSDASPRLSGTNLPAILTPFIGREQEISSLSERITQGDYRLFMILGPGGIGKTRLAIEVAHQQQQRFKDGAFFVSLAELSASSDIPSAILTALGVHTAGNVDPPLVQLKQHLHARQTLLIIDNLEHLMDGADLLLTLLQEAPELFMLVTSREELLAQAADLFILQGLAAPPSLHDPTATEYASVRLFVDRAKRINKSLKLNKSVLASVVRICQIVEGLPLALELAASAVREFSCAEIAAEIEQDLELLQTAARDVRPHHQSFQAVFEYSWNLLTKAEQRILARLAVFRGEFDYKAAKQIAGTSRLILSRLRYKSLIRSRFEGGRFSIHPLIRRLALEKLTAITLADDASDLDSVAQQHSRYYLNLLVAEGEQLTGWNPAQTFRQLQKDLDNIRQAWQFAVENSRWTELIDAPEAFSSFHSLAGLYSEGERLMRTALARFEEESEDKRQSESSLDQLKLQLLHGLCIHLIDQTRLNELQPMLDELQPLAEQLDEQACLAFVYLQRAAIQMVRGNNHDAWPHLQTALQLAVEEQASRLEGIILRAIGNVWRQRGAYQKFEESLLSALAIQRASRSAAEVQTILTWLGVYRRNQGDVWGGRRWLEEALGMSANVGDPYREATVQAGLAVGNLDVGLYDIALQELEATLKIYEGLNDVWHVAWALTYLSLCHLYLGQLDHAIATAQRSIRVSQEHNLKEIRARSQMVLGFALMEDGEFVTAEDVLQGARNSYLQMGNEQLTMQSEVALAQLAFKHGELQEAVVQIEPSVAYIVANNLNYDFEPHRTYLACYQVLKAAGDQRANDVLEKAYRSIQTQISHIDDPKVVDSYLNQIQVNADIVLEWDAMHS